MTSFTALHVRFTIEVESTMKLPEFKGSSLRGAWQNHLRTLYCAQNQSNDPLHQAMCPVCYLLSRDTGQGDERRPYSFQPPLTRQTVFETGSQLNFSVSLFGEAIQFFPYLVLAVGQMGQTQGLGSRLPNGRDKRRGRFRMTDLITVDPLSGQVENLLTEGETLVRQPSLLITQPSVTAGCEQLSEQLMARQGRLTVEFVTPTRLIHQGRLLKEPVFAPFMARLLDRLFALREQYAGEAALNPAEKSQLLQLADQIEVVDNQTDWWDIRGFSNRVKRSQELGGLIGQVTYQAPSLAIWQPLLPYLVWGLVTQVGKNVVKGCGWYRLA